MLVLSRRKSETVRIGKDILVSVARVGGGRVKLGISAPPGVPIRRGELPADSLSTEQHMPLPKRVAGRGRQAPG